MKTYFIEATNRGTEGEEGFNGTFCNHGKFMLARAEGEELARPSHVDDHPSLLWRCGWGDFGNYLLVVDLQTGEGAIFNKGLASYDLRKHAVWVCPLFEPFLVWLYKQDWTPEGLAALPRVIDLPHAEVALAGYRRPGPSPEERAAGVSSAASSRAA